jgi:serine/threonine protein kinase
MKKEIDFAAQLRHPNVVPLYGVCMHGNTEVWIIMEFADGGSLYDILSDQTKVSL